MIFPDFCTADTSTCSVFDRLSTNNKIHHQPGTTLLFRVKMFDRLQKKWKVNGLQLVLILCTFAIGGSLTGYAGRKLMNLLPIDQNWLWIIVYILLVTILWPLSVLLVSIPFGQYRFFTKYLKKIGRRMRLVKGEEEMADDGWQMTDTPNHPPSAIRHPSSITNIAIFASGAGSNAQKIIEYFRYSKKVRIVLIACNKPGAGVLNIAAQEHIPVLLIEKETFFHGSAYVDELKEKDVDLIVLAGFLWKMPPILIKNWPGRIINIHPALLPKYGGKGMYGRFVHESVITGGEKESGISIHYVDDVYDNGAIIFQARCPVLENDTPDLLAHRIHKLEHEHYPRVIEQLIEKSRVSGKDNK
jgi:formyltetrahydrofolate-dependent phosphoribosylglycinamide formyltransferase